MAQPIWLSGCPMKVNLLLELKSAFFVFLALFWAYVGQPDDHIGWAMHWCPLHQFIVLMKGPIPGKNKNGRFKKTEIFNSPNSQFFFAKMPFFFFFAEQPHNHIGWAKLMSFASIYCTNPRTNLWNFRRKKLRIGGVEICFFESAILFVV